MSRPCASKTQPSRSALSMASGSSHRACPDVALRARWKKQWMALQAGTRSRSSEVDLICQTLHHCGSDSQIFSRSHFPKCATMSKLFVLPPEGTCCPSVLFRVQPIKCVSALSVKTCAKVLPLKRASAFPAGKLNVGTSPPRTSLGNEVPGCHRFLEKKLLNKISHRLNLTRFL